MAVNRHEQLASQAAEPVVRAMRVATARARARRTFAMPVVRGAHVLAATPGAHVAGMAVPAGVFTPRGVSHG